MSNPIQDPEIEAFILEAFEQNFAELRMDAGHAITPDVKRTALLQVQLYWRMLRDVAEHVALSNNHFCTVFSQEMGETFIEYLTRLRMERAKEHLKTTELSSGEIAELIGYNDPHYFRYLFKRHVGLNPRDYRASCRR